MRISNQHVIFSMDKNNKPVAKVPSGSTVVFETLDCFSNTIKTENDLVSGIDFNKVNPATGPLYIESAQPGDVLKVTINKIDLAAQGVVVTAPGLGQLAENIQYEETIICAVDDQFVEYKGIKIPLNKMIGVIGTAPKGEGINTGTPDTHGGNMDTTHITQGNIVYLPVNVEGALLAIGDVHAVMGDGEIMGSGLEIAAEVEVQVEVIKNCHYPLPLIETPELWITIGSKQTMEEATKLALNHMVQLIQLKTPLTTNQAGMLLSLSGRLISSQVVNPNVTLRVELRKSLLSQIG